MFSFLFLPHLVAKRGGVQDVEHGALLANSYILRTGGSILVFLAFPFQ